MEIITLVSLRSLIETTKFMPFSLECDNLLESTLKKFLWKGREKKAKLSRRKRWWPQLTHWELLVWIGLAALS